MKLVFKSKEEPDELIYLNYIYAVKGYIQVTGFEYTESFSLFTTYESTRIIILLGITLYIEEEVWIGELCGVGSAFLNSDMSVEMLVK